MLLLYREWMFKGPMTMAAAFDRLAHHSTIVELIIARYRLATAQRPQTEPNPESPQLATLPLSH